MTVLSADMLLAGAETTFPVEIPAHLLHPGDGDTAPPEADGPREVVLRPLRLLDLQKMERAARDAGHLTSVLMVQQALVEPKLSIDQVNRMHAGLVEFLLREVNRISGLSMSADELETAVQAPLARACFVLSREFGWTPEQCAGLTVGQVLLYLEMLGRNRAGEGVE